jgi:hypothetical protein
MAMAGEGEVSFAPHDRQKAQLGLTVSLQVGQE